MSKNTLVEEPIKLQATPRYIRQNINKAMRGDIVRGLVELVTNSDDSYKRLEENGIKADGGIVIEIERKRKGGSIICVRDRAEGMSYEEMKLKIVRLGERTSGFKGGKTIRGLHGRGAKDIVDFGGVEFESIKNEEYTKLTLFPDTNGKIAYCKQVPIENKFNKS